MDSSPVLDSQPLNARSPAVAGTEPQSVEKREPTRHHAATDAPEHQSAPLLIGLMEFISHLLMTHVPGILSTVKARMCALAHPQDGDHTRGVQQRFADAGHRVVTWGKEHPGQALAAGAAVVTAAILVGMLLRSSAASAHSPEAAAPKPSPTPRRSKRHKKKSRRR